MPQAQPFRMKPMRDSFDQGGRPKFGQLGMDVLEHPSHNGFGVNPPLTLDPYVSNDVGKSVSPKLVPLDDLMTQAAFVSVHCPLTEATHGLIGAEQIVCMKPTAYLINTARGGIVDEDAVYDVLKNKLIAGAAF